MKKVTIMLALVALVGNIANAELLKNFKYNGSIEAHGLVVNNAKTFDKKAGDKFGDVKNRVMIDASFDLNEDVTANVSVNKCDRSYGQVPQTVAAGTADTFQFEQAYLMLKGVLGLNHKIGRQYYGNDGDIVVYYGPANWYTRGLNAFNVGLDGWYADWSKEKLMVTALVAKITETAVAPATTNTDKDLYGLTATYDYSDVVKPGVYFYEQKDRVAATNKLNNLEVIGLKANGKYAGFNYSGEYAMNLGNNSNLVANSDNKYKGSAMKLNADYGFDVMGKLVVMGEFAMGTGDKNVGDASDKSFQDIKANYRPGLIAGGIGLTAGLAQINSLNNLTTWNIGANWTPEKLNKLNLGLKYYDFSNTEKVGTVDHVGSEADLVATWTHSQNVSLKAGLAMFMPDELVVTAGKDDAVNLMSLSMNVKF